MTRNEARFLHAATALVAATGLVYGWMRYFARSDDPFAIANHPWQPELQHLHVLAAPLFVFGCGLIWIDHAWRRIRSGFAPRRRTGLALTLLLLPMVASGYLLQVSSHERWRLVWIWLHVASSLAFTAVYLAHQLCTVSGQFPHTPLPPRGRRPVPPGEGPQDEPLSPGCSRLLRCGESGSRTLRGITVRGSVREGNTQSVQGGRGGAAPVWARVRGVRKLS